MNKSIEDLDLEIAHIGINSRDENEANFVADEFCSLLNLDKKIGNSSIFAGKVVEVMKSTFMGENGHIALKTKNIENAMAILTANGYEFDMSTLKIDTEGTKVAIYFKKEIGGFAIHLLKG